MIANTQDKKATGSLTESFSYFINNLNFSKSFAYLSFAILIIMFIIMIVYFIKSHMYWNSCKEFMPKILAKASDDDIQSFYKDIMKNIKQGLKMQPANINNITEFNEYFNNICKFISPIHYKSFISIMIISIISFGLFFVNGKDFKFKIFTQFLYYFLFFQIFRYFLIFLPFGSFFEDMKFDLNSIFYNRSKYYIKYNSKKKINQLGCYGSYQKKIENKSVLDIQDQLDLFKFYLFNTIKFDLVYFDTSYENTNQEIDNLKKNLYDCFNPIISLNIQESETYIFSVVDFISHSPDGIQSEIDQLVKKGDIKRDSFLDYIFSNKYYYSNFIIGSIVLISFILFIYSIIVLIKSFKSKFKHIKTDNMISGVVFSIFSILYVLYLLIPVYRIGIKNIGWSIIYTMIVNIFNIAFLILFFFFKSRKV